MDKIYSNILASTGEVVFPHGGKIISIQTHSEGGFEGDIYESEADYNDDEVSDGGTVDTEDAQVAIRSFMDDVDTLNRVAA